MAELSRMMHLRFFNATCNLHNSHNLHHKMGVESCQKATCNLQELEKRVKMRVGSWVP